MHVCRRAFVETVPVKDDRNSFDITSTRKDAGSEAKYEKTKA